MKKSTDSKATPAVAFPKEPKMSNLSELARRASAQGKTLIVHPDGTVEEVVSQLSHKTVSETVAVTGGKKNRHQVTTKVIRVERRWGTQVLDKTVSGVGDVPLYTPSEVTEFLVKGGKKEDRSSQKELKDRWAWQTDQLGFFDWIIRVKAAEGVSTKIGEKLLSTGLVEIHQVADMTGVVSKRTGKLLDLFIGTESVLQTNLLD
jgi:hypothetical protein